MVRTRRPPQPLERRRDVGTEIVRVGNLFTGFRSVVPPFLALGLAARGLAASGDGLRRVVLDAPDDEEKLAVFRRVRDEIRRVFEGYAAGRCDHLITASRLDRPTPL